MPPPCVCPARRGVHGLPGWVLVGHLHCACATGCGTVAAGGRPPRGAVRAGPGQVAAAATSPKDDWGDKLEWVLDAAGGGARGGGAEGGGGGDLAAAAAAAAAATAAGTDAAAVRVGVPLR